MFKIKTHLMRSKLLILALFISSFAMNAQVADKPENVSPLLIGETLPNADLVDNTGKSVELKDIISEKPTVLVFYRGGWCPYCNKQLAALATTTDEIVKLGYQVVAVSPDHYEGLKSTEEKNEVNYKVYSDPGAKLIQEVGIGFKTGEGTKSYIVKKTKMDATEILPVPTVMILNKKGDILFEYVSPNYKTRLSETLLLSTLNALKADM